MHNGGYVTSSCMRAAGNSAARTGFLDTVTQKRCIEDMESNAELSEQLFELLNVAMENGAELSTIQEIEGLLVEHLYSIDSDIFLRNGFVNFIVEVFKSPGIELQEHVLEIVCCLSVFSNVSVVMADLGVVDICAELVSTCVGNMGMASKMLNIVCNLLPSYAEQNESVAFPLDQLSTPVSADPKGVLCMLLSIVSCSWSMSPVAERLVDVMYSVTEHTDWSEENVSIMFYIICRLVHDEISNDHYILDPDSEKDSIFEIICRYVDPDSEMIVLYYLQFILEILSKSNDNMKAVLMQYVDMNMIAKDIFANETLADEKILKLCFQLMCCFLTWQREFKWFAKYEYLREKASAIYDPEIIQYIINRFMDDLSFDLKKWSLALIIMLAEFEKVDTSWMLEIGFIDKLLDCIDALPLSIPLDMILIIARQQIVLGKKDEIVGFFHSTGVVDRVFEIADTCEIDVEDKIDYIREQMRVFRSLVEEG